MKTNLFLTIVGLWLLSACSALKVVTYPEPTPLSGGTTFTKTVRVADHRWPGKDFVEITTGVSFVLSDLSVRIDAENLHEFYVLTGPSYFPVVPIFWALLFRPEAIDHLLLQVTIEGNGYELYPHKVVVIQGSKELTPNYVLSNSSGGFTLGYDTKSLDFTVELRGIRNSSGPVSLPKFKFSSRWVWVLDMQMGH